MKIFDFFDKGMNEDVTNEKRNESFEWNSM